MKTLRFKDFDGDVCEARLNKDDSALPYINQRIKTVLPVETVEYDAVKRAVASFNINFTRSITPEEAKALVNALKVHILKQVDKADKYYLDKSTKKEKKKGKTK